MALLQKTQKQLLPSILFFFNTECNFGKKRAVFESGNLVDKTKHFFFTNSIIQTKPAWEKKKRNFFVWQKTLHLTKPLLFDGKTLHLTKSFFFSEFGGVLLWFLLLHQNNCFETKGFLSPICNQQMTNFGKGKNIWGRKKIDTFRSLTRELILDACYFVDKTRQAAGNGTIAHFPFRVGCTQFFLSFHFCCHVKSSKLFDVSFWERMKIIRKNLCKAFFTIWWILLLKTFWWKILENHLKNIQHATLYVNKRAILLVLDRQEKVFKQKIFLN